jgi:hypothetical protein
VGWPRFRRQLPWRAFRASLVWLVSPNDHQEACFALANCETQPTSVSNVQAVLRLRDVEHGAITTLLARFGLRLELVASGALIPGSFWGDDEAGLIGACLYARADTPVHSILHEASHWVTCTQVRRSTLHTDAADNQDEENATCYLQLLLSDFVPGFGMARAFQDMDSWGYSFRLGSAARWFANDAMAERAWLAHFELIDAQGAVTFRVRD